MGRGVGDASGPRQPIRWTGHPFVDAGIAAMCAAVGLKRPEELTPDHMVQAVARLERVLLSDQALGIGIDRNFATGSLSFVFPNSELVNRSNWAGDSHDAKVANVRQKFQTALAEELANAIQCVNFSSTGGEVCPVCGRKCPGNVMRELRKYHMPLTLGIVNFYPSFQWGMRACSLCALALRFLPLSTMHSGTQRLWILHSHADGVAVGVSRRYGWEHFERAIAARTSIDFYRFGTTGRGAAPIIYLLFELLEHFGSEVQAAYQQPYSTLAYLFVNDNREGYIEPLPIPTYLLNVLYRMRVRSRSAYGRFWRELLYVDAKIPPEERGGRERFVEAAAWRLVRGEPLVGICLVDEPMQLLGGWEGHRLYLEGVRNVPGFRLAILERVGQAVAEREDRKRWVGAFRSAQPREVYGLFLDLVRVGLLRYDELYSLMPPGAGDIAGELRDILLAVIYEATRCRQAGEPFPAMGGDVLPPPDETLERVRRIGQGILQHVDNLAAWVGVLRTARSPAQIRRVYLRAVEGGSLRFRDFVWLSPPGDAAKTWEHRDYLLAFLFDAMRERGMTVADAIADDEVLYEVQPS